MAARRTTKFMGSFKSAVGSWLPVHVVGPAADQMRVYRNSEDAEGGPLDAADASGMSRGASGEDVLLQARLGLHRLVVEAGGSRCAACEGHGNDDSVERVGCAGDGDNVMRLFAASTVAVEGAVEGAAASARRWGRQARSSRCSGPR